MTTVVYDARTREMVSDTQMSMHKTKVDKIYRLNDNSLVGVSGSLSDILLMLEYLNTPEGETAEKPTIGENNYLLRVDTNNDVFLYTPTLIGVQMYGDYFAIGSGSDYAMGAMAQGATAEEALAIAHKFDDGTGAETVRVEL
jgi:20S proteasome alpha/beta subunit